MLAASIGQKVISLVYFTLVARLLGTDQTGLYTSVLATTTIFVVLVDLGFTNVFIRDSARDRSRIPAHLATLLTVKILTGLATYAALLIFSWVMGFEPAFMLLVIVSGLTMLFDSLHLTLYGALRAYGDLRYEAMGMVMSQAITLVLGGVALLVWQGPVLFLMLAFLVASVANALLAATKLYSKYGWRPRLHWSLPAFWLLAKLGAPFALAAIFNRVYSYLDVLMLKKMTDNTITALYSTPSKITFAFQFIPLALVAALYPRLSEYFATDKKKLTRTFEDSLIYLSALVIPVTVGVTILARPITIWLFSESYVGAVVPLQILMVSLLFSFTSFPIGALLNACNRHTAQTTLTGIVLVLNAGLNFWLIPQYGAVAAAIATLVGNAVLTLGGYAVMPRDLPFNHRRIVLDMLKLGLAGVLMAGTVWWLHGVTHFMVAGLVGLGVYSAAFFALKVIEPSELKRLYLASRGGQPPLETVGE